MKLLRVQKRWSDDIQMFHLVEKSEWRSEEKWGEKLMNLHIVTYCGEDKILNKDDDYCVFIKEKHKKKICHDCYKMFKLRKRTVH